MSSHWRCWGSAFLLFAGFSVTPAFSDPLTDLTDLFSPSTKEAAAPAPTQEECLLQPGKSTPGQHWVYRLDGHRKCWFQTDEANVSTKKQAHHHAAKQPVVPPAENEAALREKKSSGCAGSTAERRTGRGASADRSGARGCRCSFRAHQRDRDARASSPGRHRTPNRSAQIPAGHATSGRRR